MTEDEAKTKWCPHARYASHNGMGINRWVNADDKQMSPEPAKCIASECMAWRWEYVHDGTFNVMLSGPSLEVTERQPNFTMSDQGFCGLAGAPQ